MEPSSPTVARRALALRLKERRRELGVNVKTITDQLGFTRNYWSAIENDRTRPERQQAWEQSLLANRDALVPVEHHTIGTIPLPNTPVKLSRTPGGIKGTSPDMGQHSTEVLEELLGLDAGAVRELIAREVVRDERAEVELG